VFILRTVRNTYTQSVCIIEFSVVTAVVLRLYCIYAFKSKDSSKSNVDRMLGKKNY
jgi:hypothetical protein